MAPNSELLNIVDALPFELAKGAKGAVAKTGRRLSTVTRHNMMRPLHCEAQQYAWGRLGSSSTVARMKDAQALKEDDLHFSIDEAKPYAELWLGTHPSGVSRVMVHQDFQHGYNSDGDASTQPMSTSSHGEPSETEFSSSSTDEDAQKCSLLDYVQSNPGLHCGSSGDDSAPTCDLSFLLKILSVRKVLSIQAHPDKKLAEQLHAQRPTVYKDPNHKPEMAIALSEKVRAMCGFRPLAEIAQHLQDYAEFRTMVGEAMAHQIEQAAAQQDQDCNHRDLLATMFQNYLQVKPEIMEFLVERMVTRLQTLGEVNHQHHDYNDVEKLILQLQEQFPGDCGIFAPLLFNIVELQQGEGLFIAANEPHAYLSGEIIECMACSDNVVRAGLTPKLKDVDTLVNMLTYDCGMPEITVGEPIDDCRVRYCPPVQDFCMEVITVPAGQTYELKDDAIVNSPSILLTLEGEASLSQSNVCSLDVSFGSAVFCSAETGCTIQAGPYGVRLTRAFTNVYYQGNDSDERL